MSASEWLEFEQLSPGDQNRLDQLCDEFEAAVRSGENVTIESFLARVEGDGVRRTTVKELIGLELYHGLTDRVASTCDIYKTRFPDYRDSVTAAFHEAAALFAPGTEFGPFRINRQIGAGGMGVVYAARDQKLDREVALKVLPFAFAQDKQWLKRFQREAKILAGLTHPHIATLYGFEELEESHLCVMEYVPGRTLAQVLEESGRLPLEDINHIFDQLAEALEYAHSRGVVHRDLKPSNILITPGGDAKLLDFGLATTVKRAADEFFPAVAEVAKTFVESPTDPKPMAPKLSASSATGKSSSADRIVRLSRDAEDVTDLTDAEALSMAGTIPYMSPEQLRGRMVDKRADIWAFGCCLFEALTGSRAFRGESHADIVSAIIDRQPDWEAVPVETPAGLRFVMKRSLEKDPNRRLRDIGDAWLAEQTIQDLRELDVITSPNELGSKGQSQTGSSLDDTEPYSILRSWRKVVPWLLLSLASIGCLFAWSRSVKPPTKAVVKYELTLPPNQHLALDQYGPLGEPRRSVAVSPDGELLAYIAVDSEMQTGTPRIFIKRLGRFDVVVPVEQTEGAYHVFFSPDSRRLGFFANGKLKTITTAGGSLDELCEVSFPVGGTWSDDGNIYIGDYFGDRLVTINEDGGQSRTIKSKWQDKDYQWIEALPNGGGLLSSQRGTGLTGIDTKSGQTHVLLPLGIDVHPFYSAGNLFYAIDGRLMATPFDTVRLETHRDPIPVLDGVRTGQWGVGQYSVSHNGKLAYIPGISGRKSKLVRISGTQIEDSGGNELSAEPLMFQPEKFGMFALSPDSQSLVIEVHKETTDIWRYDLRTGNGTRITFHGNNRHPIWSPDGKSIVFSSDRDGGMNIFLLKSALNESSEVVRLTPNSPKAEYVFSWGRDDEIGYREMSDEGHTLKAFRLSEGGAVNIRPMKDITYTSQIRFSPNGRWVVYTHWQAGDRSSVQLQRNPGSGDNWSVSDTEGGEEAVWSHSGDRIYYRIGVTWMSVEFREPSTDGDAPQLSSPQKLFSGNYINVSGMSYDLTSGGDFILLQSLQDPTPNRIRVVHNWFEELHETMAQE